MIHTQRRYLLPILFILFLVASGALAQGEPTAITRNNINIRAGGGQEHPIIGTLPNATPIVLEARNTESTWLLAHTGDSSQRGWIFASLVAMGEGVSISALPVSDERMQAAAQAYDIINQLHTSAPAVPGMTGRAWEIYRHGVELGNHGNRFSKVGDCQSVLPFFLADFDSGSYTLGDYEPLQSTIDYFAGSWGRQSLSVSGGYTIASVLDPTWAGETCHAGESPQQCEYRVWQPAFVVISMEMWRGSPASDYEIHLRNILDFWIENGVVPIVSTKSNNTEGDWSVNSAIIKVAREYDVPLWNVYSATASLPEHGLTDGFHLTFGQNDFSNPVNLEKGWVQRNLTALQTLDAMRRAVQ